MADDGMLMNFDIGDAPLMPKQSFQGGRWKDRVAAKRGARNQGAPRQRGTGANASVPADRELFREGRNKPAVEEYIRPEPGPAARPPKRQRIDNDFDKNSRSASVISGKLPPGSIGVGGGSKVTKFNDEPIVSASAKPAYGAVRGERKAPVQPEETRPSFVSGKLPPGSINLAGSKSKKFDDTDERVAAKLSQGASISWDDAAEAYENNTTCIPKSAKQPSTTTGETRSKTSIKTPQHVSSLFSFNPRSKNKSDEQEEESEPVKPSNAPLTDEMATFTTLGLSRRLAAHLSIKMAMNAPTAIQKVAIKQMVSDDSDAFIQAETGSGKTLAYLLPIVERIMAMSTKDTPVHRDSGIFAIVLAPTRELCKQIATVLEKVLRCAPWIVGTTVIGGESKQSEKARLRKGVNILIATPGRLSDHLDNTEALKVNTVRWLVLDEGDRLMELGFEDEIKGIVDRIRRRALQEQENSDPSMRALPSRRVTVLCSATMKMNVQRLGEISLTDAVHIKADPSDEEAAQRKKDGVEADDRAFSAPAQLKQAYAVVPAKMRLVTLTAILKRAFARRGSVMKAIVFISCADSVDFHFSLLSRPIKEAADEDGITPEPPAITTTDLNKDTIAYASGFSSNANSVILHRLHGSLEQKVRTATLKAFTDSPEPGVLICTDVASRGLDLPNVDYVIEYDPPFSAHDHLHRVGRTARAGRNGRALIFLLPGDEEGYISILASGYRDGKKSLTNNTAEELLRKGFGGTRDEWEERATEWQLESERWTMDSPKYLEMARRGFQSHIRAYATHVANERNIFNMQTLHLGHLAKAFALRDKPGSINVPGLRPAKMTKADRSVAARKAKRGEVEDKAPEGERVRKQRKLDLDAPIVDSNEAARRMKRKMKEHMSIASEFNIG
ncbi:P-loop containing nucleoside triphosphate hydrolase protein [Calycina marina]|uniref:ATP-dependent RNA helicase n=1 Tax=Calycina marina TaxID=1763456 RepID=A0A9P8CHJ9_9HELO|nr:P-loop containing nucleoside triphosphate hydrolase protein [Calycina marina]